MTEEFGKIHDAELTGIKIERDARTLKLEFVLPNKDRACIQMDGVTHFRTSDFILQNVVSRLLISSRDFLSKEEIGDRLGWVVRLSDTGPFATDEQLALLLAKVQSKELVLVVLEPSWGAELVAVGRSVSIIIEKA
jgi:hypothetical protein